MNRVVFVTAFFSVLLFESQAVLTPLHKYTAEPVQLSEVAKLYHDANPKHDIIYFALIIADPATVTNSQNWLGIGIGEPTSGSMLGADIVTAAFEPNAKSTCTLVDRHVPFAAYPIGKTIPNSASVFPLQDHCPDSDWRLISCERDVAKGHMLFEASRPISAVDKQDRTILPGLSAVMFAYGNSFGYHSLRRESVQVVLYDDLELPPLRVDIPNDVEGSFELQATNFSIPEDDDTVYACTSIRAPIGSGGKRMIVAAEPILQSDTRSMVHHFTAYACTGEEYASDTAQTVPCDRGWQQVRGPVGNSRAGCSVLLMACKLTSMNSTFPLPQLFAFQKVPTAFQ